MQPGTYPASTPVVDVTAAVEVMAAEMAAEEDVVTVVTAVAPVGAVDVKETEIMIVVKEKVMEEVVDAHVVAAMAATVFPHRLM